MLGYCFYFYFHFKYQSTAQKPDEESCSTQEASASVQETHGTEAKLPELTAPVAAILLILVTILIGFHSDFLVSSPGEVLIEVPATFVGLIIIPIVGNAAEHWTALREAYAGHIDLSTGVALGSAVQVANFLLPFTVLIACPMGVADMTLDLDDFQFHSLLASLLLLASTL
jgi:Ca2+:H+ antiporter